MKDEKAKGLEEYPPHERIRDISEKVLPILDAMVLLEYKHDVDVVLRGIMPNKEKEDEREEGYSRSAEALRSQLSSTIKVEISKLLIESSP